MYLQDEIKDARQNTMIGKGYRTSTGLVIPVKARNIYVSPNTIRTEYTRADNFMTGTERELRYPFFDGDKDYQVRGISVYAVKPTSYTYNSAVGNEAFTGLTNIILIFSQNGDITATNSEIAADTQGA